MHLLQIEHFDPDGQEPLTLIDREDIPEMAAGCHLSYAILSHRWEEQEVLYADMHNGAARGKTRGWEKLMGSSSAEQSEAINSMYKWYQNADMCYVYLSDVRKGPDEDDFKEDFMGSKWFTRGWTLQELLAPRNIRFYSQDWLFLGTKEDLCEFIAGVTMIPDNILRGDGLESTSIATRMSWAAGRKTRRIEDIAYCLLGIFDCYMPLIYGEGERAFIRLQEEIMKMTDDYSLFAWSRPTADRTDTSFYGLLAASPADFEHSAGITTYTQGLGFMPFSMTNKGLHIQLCLWQLVDGGKIAILPCSRPDRGRLLSTIKIQNIPGTFDQYGRVDLTFLGEDEHYVKSTSVYFPQHKQSCRLVGRLTLTALHLKTKQSAVKVTPIQLLGPNGPGGSLDWVPGSRSTTLEYNSAQNHAIVRGSLLISLLGRGCRIFLPLRFYDSKGSIYYHVIVLLGIGHGNKFAFDIVHSGSERYALQDRQWLWCRLGSMSHSTDWTPMSDLLTRIAWNFDPLLNDKTHTIADDQQTVTRHVSISMKTIVDRHNTGNQASFELLFNFHGGGNRAHSGNRNERSPALGMRLRQGKQLQHIAQEQQRKPARERVQPRRQAKINKRKR